MRRFPIYDSRFTIEHCSSSAFRRFSAIGCRLSVILTRASLFLAALPLAAATNDLANPNEIPPLRPPKPEMPPGFWEQHGLALILTSVGVVLVIVGLWRLLGKREVQIPPLPADVARNALDPLRGRPADSQLLSNVSRIVRDYFVHALDLPREEYTNNEICDQLRENHRVTDDLANRASAFLQGMDDRRFDPDANGPSLDVVEEALRLIEKSEEHLRPLRAAEVAK